MNERQQKQGSQDIALLQQPDDHAGQHQAKRTHAPTAAHRRQDHHQCQQHQRKQVDNLAYPGRIAAQPHGSAHTSLRQQNGAKRIPPALWPASGITAAQEPHFPYHVRKTEHSQRKQIKRQRQPHGQNKQTAQESGMHEALPRDHSCHNQAPIPNEAALESKDQPKDWKMPVLSQSRYQKASANRTPISIVGTPIRYSAGDSTDAICHAIGWVSAEAEAATASTFNQGRARASSSMTGNSHASVNPKA